MNSSGLMAESIRANTSKIRSTGTASSNGLMVENTKAIGKTESNTVKVLISDRMARKERVNGKKANVSSGSRNLRKSE